jgi:predicted nuclease of predicted toxin-antitoxin system
MSEGHPQTSRCASSDLPDGNRTSDAEIARLADAESRVVVSKDRDFRDGHLLRGTPARLLVVATGNISNDDLLGLFMTSSTPSSLRSTSRRSWSSVLTVW